MKKTLWMAIVGVFLVLACNQEATEQTIKNAETPPIPAPPPAETAARPTSLWEYERPTPTPTHLPNPKLGSSTSPFANVALQQTGQYPDPFLLDLAWQVVKHEGTSVRNSPEQLAQSIRVVYRILEAGMDPSVDRDWVNLSWNIVKHQGTSVRNSPEQLAQSIWTAYQALHDNFGSEP